MSCTLCVDDYDDERMSDISNGFWENRMGTYTSCLLLICFLLFKGLFSGLIITLRSAALNFWIPACGHACTESFSRTSVEYLRSIMFHSVYKSHLISSLLAAFCTYLLFHCKF